MDEGGFLPLLQVIFMAGYAISVQPRRRKAAGTLKSDNKKWSILKIPAPAKTASIKILKANGTMQCSRLKCTNDSIWIMDGWTNLAKIPAFPLSHFGI